MYSAIHWTCTRFALFWGPAVDSHRLMEVGYMQGFPSSFLMLSKSRPRLQQGANLSWSCTFSTFTVLGMTPSRACLFKFSLVINDFKYFRWLDIIQNGQWDVANFPSWCSRVHRTCPTWWLSHVKSQVGQHCAVHLFLIYTLQHAAQEQHPILAVLCHIYGLWGNTWDIVVCSNTGSNVLSMYRSTDSFINSLALNRWMWK